LKYAVAIAMH
jgi:hypothetical protein